MLQKLAKNRGAKIEGQAPASQSRHLRTIGPGFWYYILQCVTSVNFPEVEETNAFFGASKSSSKLENLSSDNHHAFLMLSAGTKRSTHTRVTWSKNTEVLIYKFN
jgi:hypothetical protein